MCEEVLHATPPDISKIANDVIAGLIPTKSRKLPRLYWFLESQDQGCIGFWNRRRMSLCRDELLRLEMDDIKDLENLILMPRNYIKKTNRANIDEKNMKNAIIDDLSRRLSVHEASRVYGIKRTTLQSRIKTMLKKQSVEDILIKILNESESEVQKFSSKYSVKQVFTLSQEKELVEYTKKSSNLNYGLSYKQVLRVAYDFAKNLPNCKMPPNWNLKEMADPQLANKAFVNAFPINNITSAFRKTGIWLLYRLVFSEEDFMPSAITENTNNARTDAVILIISHENNDDPDIPSQENDIVEFNSVPSTSTQKRTEQHFITLGIAEQPKAINITPSSSRENRPGRSLEELRLFPKEAGRKKRITKRTTRLFPKEAGRKKRITKRTTKSYIYTDSPESQEKEKLRKNELKQKRMETKRKLFCCKPEKKIKAKEDTTSSDSDVSMEIGHTSDDTDFLIKADEELQSLPKLHIDTKFNVGDFVLVKFHSKLASCYYIGQIIKSLEELEFQDKFLIF
ncbi:hypothetical protein QE152_g5637 [Popillia japonica]|uniref:HTH psq-type domain-containing protein n=1 Tax=Popillia japonica TaxID=7064 RepID=A0AAW1ML02_POPJA